MKKNNKTLILTTLLCLLPILLGLALYDRLPEQIAVHWNSAGEPDSYFPKLAAVLGLPGLFAGISLFVNFTLSRDPKAQRQSVVLRNIGLWFIPFLSLLLVPITLFIAMGVQIPIGTIVPLLLGLLLVVTGNYLPKCRQNYTVGIKLPWTLHSEENWNRTHRMAGILWIAGGFIIAAASLLRVTWLPITVLIALALVFVPFVYSYRLYKKGI